MLQISLGATAILSLSFFAANLATGGALMAAVGSVGNNVRDTCAELIANKHPGVDTSTLTFEGAAVNDTRGDDYLVRLSGEAYCGSAGCIHELCLNDGDSVRLIPFGYAAKNLGVLGTTGSNNYRDIELNGEMTLSFDGNRYSPIERATETDYLE